MIGENLYSLRKLHRLSQEDVAEKLGVSRQAVAKWETGATTPDIANCMALGRLYDVSIDDLLNYSQIENKVPIPPKGKHIFGIVTLGEKGQLVIPKKGRDIFGWKPGDQIVVLGDEERGIALQKADALMEFFGAIREAQNGNY